MSAGTSGSLARRVVLTMLALAASGVASAQDSGTAARNLYAAAAYEDALALFDKLHAAGSNVTDPGGIEQYRRIACLRSGASRGGSRDRRHRRGAASVRASLGRHLTASASRVPAGPTADAAPHFSASVRRCQSGLRSEEYEAASHQFDGVLSLLADPDLAEASNRSPLSDLRALATGFRDLSVANTPPATTTSSCPRSACDASAGSGLRARRHHGGPPVVIRQALPPLPRGVVLGGRVGVDVLIDEAGAVERSRCEARSIRPMRL